MFTKSMIMRMRANYHSTLLSVAPGKRFRESLVGFDVK